MQNSRGCFIVTRCKSPERQSFSEHWIYINKALECVDSLLLSPLLCCVEHTASLRTDVASERNCCEGIADLLVSLLTK